MHEEQKVHDNYKQGDNTIKVERVGGEEIGQTQALLVTQKFQFF
ncbi:hypothetical protein AB1K83_13445 [Sporosarcina sp. 179-K 3D1 HS]